MRRAVDAERMRFNVGGSLLAGALLMSQVGLGLPVSRGTPMARALNQVKATAMRPVPAAPPQDRAPVDRIWVPDRFVSIPGEPGERWVPGHWERPISDREVHVPPLAIFNVTTGAPSAIPAGRKAPPALRQGP